MQKILITIFTILLFTTNSLADKDNTNNNSARKDIEKKDDSTAQKIIDEFYAYAGTIKPEIREEIQKYRVEIVNINKKKRELFNSLSKEAQNFLTQEQKYKQRLSFSVMANKDDKENDTAKDNSDSDKK